MKLLIPLVLLTTSVCLGAVDYTTSPLCVSNLAEFTKRQNDLPKCLQTLPIIFVVDGFIKKGAITVRKSAEGLLISETHSVADPSGKMSEPTPIKAACIGKDKDNATWVKVELQNGSKNELKVTGNSTVDYRGTELKLSNQETFNNVVRKIHPVPAHESQGLE